MYKHLVPSLFPLSPLSLLLLSLSLPTLFFLFLLLSILPSISSLPPVLHHAGPPNAYSHLEHKMTENPQNPEEDNSQYKDLGDIEPDDFIRFAYQIASGMVGLLC